MFNSKTKAGNESKSDNRKKVAETKSKEKNARVGERGAGVYVKRSKKFKNLSAEQKLEVEHDLLRILRLTTMVYAGVLGSTFSLKDGELSVFIPSPKSPISIKLPYATTAENLNEDSHDKDLLSVSKLIRALRKKEREIMPNCQIEQENCFELSVDYVLRRLQLGRNKDGFSETTATNLLHRSSNSAFHTSKKFDIFESEQTDELLATALALRNLACYDNKYEKMHMIDYFDYFKKTNTDILIDLINQNSEEREGFIREYEGELEETDPELGLWEYQRRCKKWQEIKEDC